jgi:hypothetical protein
MQPFLFGVSVEMVWQRQSAGAEVSLFVSRSAFFLDAVVLLRQMESSLFRPVAG